MILQNFLVMAFNNATIRIHEFEKVETYMAIFDPLEDVFYSTSRSTKVI